MNYKIFNFIVVLSVSLIYGCSPSGGKALRIDNPQEATITVSGTDSIVNWHIDCSRASENFLTDYIDSISIIKLETTDSCLIGTITDLIMVNDTIIVADASKSQCIYLFGSDGRFIRKIGSRGDGPMEYGTINHIEVHGDTIEVLDWTKAQLLNYSISSDKVERHSLNKSRPHNITRMNDTIYVSSYASSVTNRDQFALTWIDRNDSVTATARPFRYMRGIPAGSFLHSSEGDILYYRNDCDTIFKITPSSLIPAYTLGLGGDINEFIEATLDLSERDFTIKWYGDDNSPLSYYDILEYGEDWIISFRKGPVSYISVVDKATGISKTYFQSDINTQHLYVPFLFFGGSNKSLLSYIDYVFISEVDRKERQRLYDAFPYLENVVEQYDFEEQNPLVCILKRK